MQTVRPSSLCPTSAFGESDVGIAISSSVTWEFVVLVATMCPSKTAFRFGAPLYTGAEVSAVTMVPSSWDVYMPRDSSPHFDSRYWNCDCFSQKFSFAKASQGCVQHGTRYDSSEISRGDSRCRKQGENVCKCCVSGCFFRRCTNPDRLLK